MAAREGGLGAYAVTIHPAVVDIDRFIADLQDIKRGLNKRVVSIQCDSPDYIAPPES